ATGLSQALVSHHVSALLKAELIEVAPQGRSNLISICCEQLAAPVQWLAHLATLTPAGQRACCTEAEIPARSVVTDADGHARHLRTAAGRAAGPVPRRLDRRRADQPAIRPGEDARLDEQRESPRTHQGTTFGGGDSILLLLDTADAGRNAQRRGRLPDSDDLPHRLTDAQPDHRRRPLNPLRSAAPPRPSYSQPVHRRRHRNHLRVDYLHRLHALHPGRLTARPVGMARPGPGEGAQARARTGREDARAVERNARRDTRSAPPSLDRS